MNKPCRIAKLRTRLSSSKMFNSAGRSQEKTASITGETIFNNQSIKLKEINLAVPEVHETTTTSALDHTLSSGTSCTVISDEEIES